MISQSLAVCGDTVWSRYSEHNSSENEQRITKVMHDDGHKFGTKKTRKKRDGPTEG